MGSDSEQYKDASPAMAPSPSDVAETRSDALDLLASIGYEAADPSFFCPQWQGLSDHRDLR